MSQPPHTAEAASEPQDLAVTISAWMDGDDAAPMPEAVLTKQGQQTWQVYQEGLALDRVAKSRDGGSRCVGRLGSKAIPFARLWYQWRADGWSRGTKECSSL